MRVVDFNVAEYVADSRFGSAEFSVHPVGRVDQAIVNVLRLGKLGAIGEHRAVAEQLMIVVSGSAVVTSGDLSADVTVGQAVHFEPGELHTTTSLEGASLLVIEGTLEL
jgi:mannose-6-phosphate isomerase-like protein (cupin superfamily)